MKIIWHLADLLNTLQLILVYVQSAESSSFSNSEIRISQSIGRFEDLNLFPLYNQKKTQTYKYDTIKRKVIVKKSCQKLVKNLSLKTILEIYLLNHHLLSIYFGTLTVSLTIEVPQYKIHEIKMYKHFYLMKQTSTEKPILKVGLLQPFKKSLKMAPHLNIYVFQSGSRKGLAANSQVSPVSLGQAPQYYTVRQMPNETMCEV